MEKRTPIQKSIVRHKLKEIDKKWAGRKVKGPVRDKVLDNAKKKQSYMDHVREKSDRKEEGYTERMTHKADRLHDEWKDRFN